jgi:hypothetical protein
MPPGTRADRRWGLPALGVVLAVPLVPVFLLHPDLAYELLAMLLVLGAGVRLGAGPAGPAGPAARTAAIATAVALVVMALLGLFWTPFWLVWGLLLLAAWTFAAHRRRPHSPLLPFGTAWCLAAAGVLVWWLV